MHRDATSFKVIKYITGNSNYIGDFPLFKLSKSKSKKKRKLNDFFS